MSNSKQIEDLVELTSLSGSDQVIVNDVSDTSFDVGGTAKRATVANVGSVWGALEFRAATNDSDISAAVGYMDYINTASYTADRDYILPATAAVGARCGIMISNGDDAYELDLHTPSGSGDTINGVDSSVGTASWSRLFITGEVVIFRCVVANSAWIVEYDGRIPCKTVLNRNTAQSISHNSLEKISLNNSVLDVGNLGDTATNNRIDIRRSGNYMIRGSAAIGNLDNDEYIQVTVDVSGTNYLWIRLFHSFPSGPGTEIAIPSGFFALVNGDYVELFCKHFQGAAQNTITTPISHIPRLEVVEQF